MIQPPSNHATCPSCGNTQAVLILTESNLPQRDGFGFPRYYCPSCNAPFSVGEKKPLEPQCNTPHDEVQE